MTLLSFDIEDWFQSHLGRHQYNARIWDQFPARVERNTQKILDFLDVHQRKATFFIVGWIADHHPQLIKEIHARGHHIGTHSYWHQFARVLKPQQFEADLQRSIGQLSNLIGEPIIAYRAPGYSLHFSKSAHFDILARNGISIDSSIQVRSDTRTWPALIHTKTTPILEFPLVTTALGIPYTGGGYFRALPQKILLHLFQEDRYRIIYFHPRDVDENNPYTNLFSFGRNWLNSLNTQTCLDKLANILNLLQTTTLKEAATQYDQNNLADAF